MSELTGQPADFQSLRGAARVGRLILSRQESAARKVWANFRVAADPDGESSEGACRL